MCSLQIPNLHFSHPLIRASWREAGRDAHSGDRKDKLPSIILYPVVGGGARFPQVFWDEGGLGPGQVFLCLFWPLLPLLTSLLALGLMVREVRQLVHTHLWH